MRALGTVLDKWGRRTRRTWMFASHSGAAQMIALLALRTLVVGCAAWLWWRGRATAGDVTFVLTSYFIVHGYLRDTGQHIANLQRSVNEMEDMVGFESQPLGVADRAGARPIRVTAGEIVFDRVTFRYGMQVEPLFRDFSIRIEPGERVGLVGHSGSGKTTFVKLLHRLYDVTGGRIVVDGQDIAHVTQDSLRAQLALVPQEPILFHRSLVENIAYGQARGEASPDRGGRAAGQRACVHRAAGEGLRDAGRRARRQALGRRAPESGAGSRFFGQRSGAGAGRGNFEPRLGVRGADPGGDGSG